MPIIITVDTLTALASALAATYELRLRVENSAGPNTFCKTAIDSN